MEPGCTHKHESSLFLTPKCHPNGKVSVLYNVETGTLFISCGKCSKPVTEIVVASRVGAL